MYWYDLICMYVYMYICIVCVHILYTHVYPDYLDWVILGQLRFFRSFLPVCQVGGAERSLITVAWRASSIARPRPRQGAAVPRRMKVAWRSLAEIRGSTKNRRKLGGCCASLSFFWSWRFDEGSINRPILSQVVCRCSFWRHHNAFHISDVWWTIPSPGLEHLIRLIRHDQIPKNSSAGPVEWRWKIP